MLVLVVIRPLQPPAVPVRRTIFGNFWLVWSYRAMGGFTCCVPGCYNNSTRDKGFGFYVFPKERKLRETWIQRINRAGRNGRFSKFTPTTGHRVCSAHFEGGKKTYMNRVPTIFPLRQQKVEKRRPLRRTKPEVVRSSTVPPGSEQEVSAIASSDSDDPLQQEVHLHLDHAYSSQQLSYDELVEQVAKQKHIITELLEQAEAANATVAELNNLLKRSQQDHAETKKLCDRLQQKNRCLRLQLSAMQEKVRRCKTEAAQNMDITYEALVKDEKKLRYYTGFTSSKRLDTFWSLLEPDAKRLCFWQMKETASEDRNFILPLKTQLVLVLMRLKLGLDGLDLAYRFGVSKTTVSRIWVTWLDFLDNRLCQVPTWMSPQLCDKYRPKAFIDKGYTTVDGILDCTEIFIETPSSFRVQSETYSSYKKHNTAKGLVVCSPNGFVMFVSDLAPGRLSDKALTKACGVLEKFSPGRSVMADRGFTIEEECKQHSLHLNIPPFLEGRPQLSEADETETRLIASVRIHVERVIRKIKTYKILSQVFPNSMSGQLNKVWHICALLTNFVGEPLL
ncbi:uncharacterized protein LOC119458352 [Dermacentor silvarum]|uniref:uncharacterized protein LOC119437459 n=1 Tax=Dermacentor silvarum TaxID=543639 RepID=UPI002101AD8B|nr:uncharacterized protein LOC119437459 [Dermacentor silvarum]XP_037573003.2 uncharacterized protein LOC119455659 [Dermacentor silvarum]XP_037575774.2 uncharacterized protein LOC119458050 isoform X2 [Dermacentor silvarum]XP_037576112.2 uncharacterized protein LOC119458352 [Dermacentor silvarum]